MVANLAGLTNPGGIAGTANAAHWVLATFASAPVIALLTAWRVTRRERQA
jgi:hypothetical protein